MEASRRNFIKKTVAASAAMSLGGILPGFTAKSYASILGSNERINVGVMGVNARGLALAKNFGKLKDCEIISISDVDSRAMDKCINEVEKDTRQAPLKRFPILEKHWKIKRWMQW